jgi:hypothetical protein
MTMTRRISLSVNDAPIEMDYFVQGFVDHTVVGMVSSLEGVGDINDIGVSVNGNKATVSVNSDKVPLNEFAAAIVSSTVRGLVSSLKGAENPQKIQIGIER